LILLFACGVSRFPANNPAYRIQTNREDRLLGRFTYEEVARRLTVTDSTQQMR